MSREAVTLALIVYAVFYVSHFAQPKKPVPSARSRLQDLLSSLQADG